jgi:Protein of unknown function (DUF3551)
MRTFLLVAIAFFALSLSTIGSRADGTWCANYGSHGGTNCGFYSFEQCRATVSGIGGSCQPNPFSRAAREPQRRYRGVH